MKKLSGLCLILVAVLVEAAMPVVRSAPVHLVEEQPVQITAVAPNVFLIDFGRVAFGNLQLLPPASATGKIAVHFGEAFEDGRINRKPPGSVRYAQAEAALNGEKSIIVAPAADARNTKPPKARADASKKRLVGRRVWHEIALG